MALERVSGGSSLIDVLDRVLDKGIVIDAWVRVSLVGIDLITVDARVVVASIATYRQHWETVGEVPPVSTPPTVDATSRLVGRRLPIPPRLPATLRKSRVARFLFIVARQLPDVYEHLREQFGREPDVEVILDRRIGERRQDRTRKPRARADRRQADRRQNALVSEQLRATGYAFVRLDK